MIRILGLLFVLFTFGFQVEAGVSNVLNYRDPLNGGDIHGWDGPLKGLKERLDPGKNYALFIIHRPYNAFILNDYLMFRETVVVARKALENPKIPALGHIQVGWACYYPGRESDGRYYGFTGQSGEHGNRNAANEVEGQGSSMLLDWHFGMSLFFANFTDGNLESSAYSTKRLMMNLPAGFAWIAVEISQRDCARGVNFLNRYIGTRAYRNFSFYLDPRKFQGGGCTSFGSVFAEKLGIFSKGLVDFWNRPFLIPKSLVGNPDGEQFSQGEDLPYWVGREDMPYPEQAKLPPQTQLPRWMWQSGYRDNIAGGGKLLLSPFPAGLRGYLKTRVYDPELILLTLKSIAERAQNEGKIKLPHAFDLKPRRAYGLARKHGPSSRPSAGGRSSYVELSGDFKHFPYMKSVHKYVNKPEIDVPNVKLGIIGDTFGLILEKGAW